MTPEQIATATAALIAGSTQTAAAALIGVPLTTMRSHIERRDEITQAIKDAQLRFITTSLAQAVDNQCNKIEISADLAKKMRNNVVLPEGYKTYAELGTRAEEKLLESVGIHPSHTQSISLTQIMIDARAELSPAVERLLVGHLTGDVIDVESMDCATIAPSGGDKG